MAGKDSPAPILIKRHDDGHHDDHHGGAWKVAYADFVTAMMAFFLLLWLLGATNSEQRKGIAEYFSPDVPVSQTSGGSNGLLGGQSLARDGTLAGGARLAMPLPPAPPAAMADLDDSTTAGEAERAKAESEREENRFKQAQDALRKAIEELPELKEFASNIVVDQTPEGLRIQTVDREQNSMFPSGSAEMTPHTRALLAAVARIIAPLPNRIAVRGHTDNRPFAAGSRADNWSLSAERANVTRRTLIESGVGADRFAEVAGRADTEPFVASDPSDARNRRISVVLLRAHPTTVAAALSHKPS
jgi:chemotaxis protein MotB